MATTQEEEFEQAMSDLEIIKSAQAPRLRCLKFLRDNACHLPPKLYNKARLGYLSEISLGVMISAMEQVTAAMRHLNPKF